MATTTEFAPMLDYLAVKAEKAARVADRFARGDKIPTRYVVYYAGPVEWRSWFKMGLPDWTGGVALSISTDRWDLILDSGSSDESTLDNIMRHELTHAASMAGPYKDRKEMWSLAEGLAELAEMDGIDTREYPSLPQVKKLIDAGAEQDLVIDEPEADTPSEVVSGRYGLAFLGMRCIAERHGEEKLVEFFHLIVHDHKELHVAAPAVLGVEWSALNSECFDYAKQAAR